MELDSPRRHRVIEEAPNDLEGTHVPAGPRTASRLQRDYVTHSTPALLVFRLVIVMCAAGLMGANACFAVYGSSVAFLHSQMDEVVFAYRLQADQLVRPQGSAWEDRWLT